MSAELLEQAIALSQDGNQREARELLVQVITADVHNVIAWLWYAHTLPTNPQQMGALEECLYHNPDHYEAKKRLAALRVTAACVICGKDARYSRCDRCGKLVCRDHIVVETVTWSESVGSVGGMELRLDRHGTRALCTRCRNREHIRNIQLVIVVAIGMVIIACLLS